MIRRFPPARRRARAGFTLIELLTVIAIILVLAGLLLNVAGNANYKSSVARAQGEVKAMETALESYKADNGTYPRTAVSDSSVTSDGLNAQSQSNTSPGTNYQAGSRVLFQALTGYGKMADGVTPNKPYMDFKPSQLPPNTTTPDGNTYVVDPFGNSYGYSTANLKAQESGGDVSTNGYNPTFDLWSTAGYGGNGKSYDKTGLSAAAYNTLWVKNW